MSWKHNSLIILFFSVCLSCQLSEEEQTEVEEPKEKESIFDYLVDSKWKLAGMVDTGTGELLIIPAQIFEVYKLTIDNDSTFTVTGVGVNLTIDLKKNIRNDNSSVFDVPLILKTEYKWYSFYWLMHEISSFSATSDEIKLFVLKGNYYLSYITHDKIDPPTTYLKGTQWKLFGYMDTQTNTLIKKLQPYDCEYCYTLTFESDYKATAYGISQTAGTLDLTDVMQHIGLWPTQTLVMEKYNNDGEYYPMNDFIISIELAVEFEVSPNELKLFLPNGDFTLKSDHYLLFKPF